MSYKKESQTSTESKAASIISFKDVDYSASGKYPHFN